MLVTPYFMFIIIYGSCIAFWYLCFQRLMMARMTQLHIKVRCML